MRCNLSWKTAKQRILKRPQLGHISSPSINFHFLIHKMMMKINTQVNINLVLGYCFLSQ